MVQVIHISAKKGTRTVYTTGKPPVTTRIISRTSQPIYSNFANPNFPQANNSKFKTTNIYTPSLIGQSSLNKGRFIAPPVRQLSQSKISITPRTISGGFQSTLIDGGTVQVHSQLEVRTVDRIRQEQRDAKLLNTQQSERFWAITNANFGKQALGGDTNIYGQTKPLTPLGVNIRKKGITSVIKNSFGGEVPNPTFTFSGTFGEQGQLIRQRTNNIDNARIESILDNRQTIGTGKVAVVGSGKLGLQNGEIRIVNKSEVASLKQQGLIIGALSNRQYDTINSSEQDFFIAPSKNNKVSLTTNEASANRLAEIDSGEFEGIGGFGIGSQASSPADIFDSPASEPAIFPTIAESTGRRFGNVKKQSGGSIFGSFGDTQLPSAVLAPILPFASFLTPTISPNEIGRIPEGIGVGAQNLGFYGFELYNVGRDAVGQAVGLEPFKVVRDSEGNITEKTYIGSKNPLTFTPTAIDTLETGLIGSIFAPNPKETEQTGRRFGTNIPTQPQLEQEKFSIWSDSVTKATQQFEADKGLNIGAGLFFGAEILSPIPIGGKAKTGTKVVQKSGVFDSFFDFFKPKNKSGDIIQTNIIVPKTAGQKVINQIKGDKKKNVITFNADGTKKEVSVTSAQVKTAQSIYGKNVQFVNPNANLLGTPNFPQGDAFGLLTDITNVPKAGIRKDQSKQFTNESIFGKFGIESIALEDPSGAIIKSSKPPKTTSNAPFIFGKTKSEDIKNIIDARETDQVIGITRLDDVNQFGTPIRKNKFGLFGTQSILPDTSSTKILRTADSGNLPKTKKTKGGFPEEREPIGGGSGQQIFDDIPVLQPYTKLKPYKKIKRNSPQSLVPVTIGGGIGIGYGISKLFQQEEIDTRIINDNKDKERDGLIPIIAPIFDDPQIQDVIPELDQPTTNVQTPDLFFGQPPDQPNVPVQDQPPFIPQIPELTFQGNPTAVPFRFKSLFTPFGSGGSAGGQADEGDFSFFRVFAVSRQPFGRTSIPLGGFVDSDRPINRISDVLTTKEIFRENRRTKNPLRSPKNIADDDPFLADLFGIKKTRGKGKKGKKGKGKKKSTNIFDLDIYA